MAYRIVNATKELKRDLEMSMFQNTASNTGGATTARVLKGAAGFCTTSSVTTAVTRTDIQAMLQTLFSSCCNPDAMYVNAAMKTKVSNLAGLGSQAYQWNMDADAKRFSYAVNIWDGDFGVQRVVAAHQMGTQSIFAAELQHWRHAILRPLKTVDLAVDGDNQKKWLGIESTLEALATASSGAYYTWTG